MATKASRNNSVFPREDVQTIFSRINVPLERFKGTDLGKHSPIDGEKLCELGLTDEAGLNRAIDDAQQAFLRWRTVPAPERGKLVYTFAELVRRHKAALAAVVTLDCGKTETEALGEIQEVIDICDFAIGLSRQLYGLTIATERPEHRMAETWHPLGIFGQITAFNFPAAVWSWGAMIALVCGDSVIWKPSEKSPLTAIALSGLMDQAIAACDSAPAKLAQVVLGGAELGRQLASDTRIPLVSATGSTTMGRDVAARVGARLGRSTLELGGNNAAIVSDKADLDLAIRGVAFAAVGTAGQRCTSLRRLIVHESIADEFVARLKTVYAQLRVGRPDDPDVHVGPLIDERAHQQMASALQQASAEGGSVFGGERVLEDQYPDAFYVNPAIVSMPAQSDIVEQETFAPILYVMKYATIDEAIALQNGVSQGLSSAIFTTDMREAEYFLSASGSDCGIANVNIGTSGAEIGGAFGGEKATGGGRAAGSDTWKAFMRRATNTVNYSSSLPLAQGVEFDV
ncbi:L-piperidine-6-carboxylate dehydrogenase [Parahaliea mediterranea]|uniref:aldehyde dehydrogenase (NAD(+)) n=1 Tax=Parahaliea mediterranea TaxID=651086 RepID=A0A939DIT0_9GAMM|nr:aldehyde dehydrogenase family protein [Parahaliea mediterranea]MBN7798763.1 aldehyde dehydrogenase family protein [Parahaliea mediterranea]